METWKVFFVAAQKTLWGGGSSIGMGPFVMSQGGALVEYLQTCSGRKTFRIPALHQCPGQALAGLQTAG